MTKGKKITLLVAAVLILASLVFAAITDAANGTVDCPDCDGPISQLICETCAGEGAVRGTLWALLPPLIAIGLALITKEVYSSLFIGILSGALLYSDFSFTGTVDGVINEGLISAVSGSAGIFMPSAMLAIKSLTLDGRAR